MGLLDRNRVQYAQERSRQRYMADIKGDIAKLELVEQRSAAAANAFVELKKFAPLPETCGINPFAASYSPAIAYLEQEMHLRLLDKRHLHERITNTVRYFLNEQE